MTCVHFETEKGNTSQQSNERALNPLRNPTILPTVGLHSQLVIIRRSSSFALFYHEYIIVARKRQQ